MRCPRVNVDLEELGQIIERGTQAPLSESESEKLKSPGRIGPDACKTPRDRKDRERCGTAGNVDTGK